MWRWLIFPLIFVAAQSPVLAEDEAVSSDALLLPLLQVQDRIAAGDAAALPLQKHLMFMFDASVAEEGDKSSNMPEKLRALFIYGIIGSSSSAVTSALKEIRTSKTDVELARAIVDYRTRRGVRAAKRLTKIDLSKLDSRVSPFVAFALGNLLIRQYPQQAISQYDFVRLTAPGTLLEEATLRRLMVLYASRNNGERFVAMAKQYARRFLTSPYRQQYVESLQRGLISMRRMISTKDIKELGTLMPPAFAAAMYMHLIRPALNKGYFKLANFAIDQFIDVSKSNDISGVSETQLELLRLLAQMSNADPKEMEMKFGALNTAALSKSDLQLYDSARNILSSILSPIDEYRTQTQEVATPENKSKSVSENLPQKREVSPTQTQDGSSGDSDTSDDVEQLIDSVEERLKAVDELLSE